MWQQEFSEFLIQQLQSAFTCWGFRREVGFYSQYPSIHPSPTCLMSAYSLSEERRDWCTGFYDCKSISGWNVNVHTVHTRCIMSQICMFYYFFLSCIRILLWKSGNNQSLSSFPHKNTLNTASVIFCHPECGLPVRLPFRRIPHAALATLLVTVHGSSPCVGNACRY